MVPFSKELGDELKHSLNQVGKKYIFSIKKLGAEDAGLYSVDVEGVNVFSTEFKGNSPQVEYGLLLSAYSQVHSIFSLILFFLSTRQSPK